MLSRNTQHIARFQKSDSRFSSNSAKLRRFRKVTFNLPTRATLQPELQKEQASDPHIVCRTALDEHAADAGNGASTGLGHGGFDPDNENGRLSIERWQRDAGTSMTVFVHHAARRAQKIALVIPQLQFFSLRRFPCVCYLCACELCFAAFLVANGT